MCACRCNTVRFLPPNRLVRCFEHAEVLALRRLSLDPLLDFLCLQQLALRLLLRLRLLLLLLLRQPLLLLLRLLGLLPPLPLLLPHESRVSVLLLLPLPLFFLHRPLLVVAVPRFCVLLRAFGRPKTKDRYLPASRPRLQPRQASTWTCACPSAA